MINKPMDNKQNNYQYADSIPELSFWDYVTIIRIHIKKIIVFSIIGFFYSLYHTYTIPPTYIATSSVMIREKPGANMIMDITGNRSQNRMINEMQLIKSRALAKEVIKVLWNTDRKNNLHLFGTRIYYPKGERVRRIIKELVTLGLHDPSLNIAKTLDGPYRDNIGDRYADRLTSGINVENIRNTNILKITYKSINADEARRIANIIANTYVLMDKKWSNENAIKSVQFLDSLVNNQEKKIEVSDKSTRDFMLANNMYSLDGDASSIVRELNSYEAELYTIKTEINIRKEQIKILNSRLTEEEKTLTSQLMNNINPQLISLRMEIGILESQIVQNTNIYGNDHTVVIEMMDKVDIMKKELAKKVSMLTAQGLTVQDPLKSRQDMIMELLNLDSEVMSYELREIEINKMLKLFNEKLNDIPDKQIELARLNRDSDILNQNYTFLRQKLEEAKLSVAVKIGNAVMLDMAKMPQNPISPNHKRNLMLGSFLGFSLGLILTFLIEFLDNTLKTIDEIEKYQLSVLGIIPSIGPVIKKNTQLLRFWKDKINGSSSNKRLQRRLITREDPKSPVSEAYRSLRTSMLYSSDKELKSILVSSAGPGEGKTTTVANLAITYANLGKKTILVDTDLRRPVIHKVFNLNREPGVTNYLSGQTDDIFSLIKKSDIENLSTITSGIIPPNPSEMLGSQRMIDLVSELNNNFEMVLFDSPPLVAVTDANMIVKEIDRIVLVVKVGQTDKKAFYHTINNLKNIEAPLGGIIMNAVTNKSSYGSYYYYYYHQYYNYYGSDRDDD